MVRHGSRKGHRRVSLDAVLALAIGVVAILATTQSARGEEAASPAPRQERSAPLTEPAAPTARDPAPAAPPPTTAPALHAAAQVALGPGRPKVAVPQPPPLFVVPPGSGTTAVILGDSYSTGWKGAGIGARGWPALVGRAQGWRMVNLAVAGTGFINPGWTNQPVAARVSEAIRQNPDVVFVAAGHNDSRGSSSATAREASEVVDRIHRALPDALLVIVAPIWPSGHPPARCLALRDALRLKAASVGAIFVDPLADGWFAGDRQALIGPDGIHPRDAGHRAMAAHVLAALSQPE